MRIVSADFDAECAGTTRGDRLEVNAWRAGTVVAPALSLTAWDLAWDASRQVQAQHTFTVADPDGSLAPWGMGDALAPGGSRLQVTWVSGLSGVRVPMGWFRIRSADPAEAWRTYRSAGTSILVPGGGSVTVRADDETATAILDRFDAESSPIPGATCLGEVRRLLGELMPVVVDPAVVDAPAPTDLTYGRDRMSAVESLLDVVSARHRMGGDGSFQVIPAAATGSVWSITGGPGGVLARIAPSLSDDGLFNAAASSNATATGLPLVGRSYITGGPLKWGVNEPFGRVPVFHAAIATTRDGVNADARTVLATAVSTAYIDIPVECVMHPGPQLWDTVDLSVPTIAGWRPLLGQIVTMRALSAGAVPAKRMSLTVRVAVDALEALAEVVRRG